MKIDSNDFRVRPGRTVHLNKWPTMVKPICRSKKEYQELLRQHVEKLSALQQLHYASGASYLRFPSAEVPSIFSRGDSKFVSKCNGQVGLA